MTNDVFNSFQSTNVDGTPMCGGVDIRGNPFGVVDITTHQDYDMINNAVQTTNVDETPICRGVDIKGNMNGSVETSEPSFSFNKRHIVFNVIKMVIIIVSFYFIVKTG